MYEDDYIKSLDFADIGLVGSPDSTKISRNSALRCMQFFTTQRKIRMYMQLASDPKVNPELLRAILFELHKYRDLEFDRRVKKYMSDLIFDVQSRINYYAENPQNGSFRTYIGKSNSGELAPILNVYSAPIDESADFAFVKFTQKGSRLDEGVSVIEMPLQSMIHFIPIEEDVFSTEQLPDREGVYYLKESENKKGCEVKYLGECQIDNKQYFQVKDEAKDEAMWLESSEYKNLFKIYEYVKQESTEKDKNAPVLKKQKKYLFMNMEVKYAGDKKQVNNHTWFNVKFMTDFEFRLDYYKAGQEVWLSENYLADFKPFSFWKKQLRNFADFIKRANLYIKEKLNDFNAFFLGDPGFIFNPVFHLGVYLFTVVYMMVFSVMAHIF